MNTELENIMAQLEVLLTKNRMIKCVNEQLNDMMTYEDRKAMQEKYPIAFTLFDI